MKMTVENKKEYLRDILSNDTFKNIKELGFVGDLLVHYYYYKFNKVFAKLT